ncbi:hypothetical protein E2562_020737 [Oryza meyeriana var. granulata]|uniref:Uncharacterized protein n=1 Tax=Oryza meyeriana var. granulata TaxID=110450 RepID=A0A6G1EN62_9ORYZ|nr:hypothetical protein E2562_020737 [Oryza meyeriana var. granulata]
MECLGGGGRIQRLAPPKTREARQRGGVSPESLKNTTTSLGLDRIDEANGRQGGCEEWQGGARRRR